MDMGRSQEKEIRFDGGKVMIKYFIQQLRQDLFPKTQQELLNQGSFCLPTLAVFSAALIIIFTIITITENL